MFMLHALLKTAKCPCIFRKNKARRNKIEDKTYYSYLKKNNTVVLQFQRGPRRVLIEASATMPRSHTRAKARETCVML